MEHNDFRIGIHFYLGRNKYLCTDIGKRTIVAISADYADIVTHENGNTKTTRRKLTRKDFSGPPYFLSEVVFDEFDIPECYRRKTKS
jgi:hypothetical protein